MLEYLLSITRHLFQEITVLLFLVFLLARTKGFKKYMLNHEASPRDKLLLTLVFGALSILGTYTGMPVDGAIANTRAVGAVVGGLIGGPFVGAGAGLMAGVHRLFFGGATVYASAASTIIEGFIAGLLASKINLRKERWRYALFLTAALEVFHMALLLLSPSPEQALEIVKAIGAPMIIINSIGVAAFLAVIDTLSREREKVEGAAAQLTLEIANKTLTYMRKGLNPASAAQTIRIIAASVENLAAVAITSRDRILAFEGMGKDHHRPGSDSGIITTSTRQVMKTGQYLVVQQKAGIGCVDPDCPLASKVVVPLTYRGEVAGALVLYKAAENGISPFEVELAIGLGQLVSTQIEASGGELEAQLRTRAEIKALQAQINPHFLFNAINTIVYYCRKQPETARELLLHLGQFYRNNISGLEELVDLETEIRHVDSYVHIEMARFHGKLKVVYDIPPGCSCLLPPLILQPLVENAIRHGIYPKKRGGAVKVSARMTAGTTVLTVEDDGVGMDPAVAAKALENDPGRKTIGLGNVNARLKSLYGENSGIRIESAPDRGTRVTITIPGERTERDATQSPDS
ncbi:MAG: LytS/YhcK type 5TM receptor domain-containing protein [Sporomusaceae bacterium]|nr:LytS/YhcK type 5TM receptor domain-containing protein [Sporomusaceae bacterium]